MTTPPLVSVIMPAYNTAEFVRETLGSVLRQTYKKIEVIVVDDGSTDDTLKILTSVANTDDRIIVLHQSNGGVAAARNLGIQASRGEFVAPVDADDIWHPLKIEKQVDRMRGATSNVGLVYTWYVRIDENGARVGLGSKWDVEGWVYSALVLKNFIGNGSVPLIRRVCLEEVNGFNASLKERGAEGCEDWDIYLRIAERHTFRVVPAYLVAYRRASNSMSSNRPAMVKSKRIVTEHIKRRHPEIPPQVIRWSWSHVCVSEFRSSYRSRAYRMLFVSALQVLHLDPLALLAVLFEKIVNFGGKLIKGAVLLISPPGEHGRSSGLPHDSQSASNRIDSVFSGLEGEAENGLEEFRPYNRLFLRRWDWVMRNLTWSEFSPEQKSTSALETTRTPGNRRRTGAHDS